MTEHILYEDLGKEIYPDILYKDLRKPYPEVVEKKVIRIERITRQELLTIGEKQLLVEQKKIDGKYYTIVAGYTRGQPYTTKKGARAVKGKGVPKKEQDQVTAFLLEHHFKGPIWFNE